MTENVDEIIQRALEELKGQEIKVLDVTSLSEVMDSMVIATGTSNRHVKSLAENIIAETKKSGVRPFGVEGLEAGDWVLVDYGDTVVHVMLKATRDFYELEKLWSMEPSSRKKNP